MTTIIVGGDIYPVGNIQKAFIEGSAKEIFHDLLDNIRAADLSIVNLEAPLISRETPIFKPGGVLAADAKAIKGFAAAGWSILNLANNHSFDQGSRGLQDTMNTIKNAGLTYIGAGSNIEEAQTPIINEINGERIIIYSMAEREFSMADHDTPGANPLDLINFTNAIRMHKKDGYFIVLIHGGKEYYPYPSPEMMRRCRFMVDMGADAVICCHTHCPLPWEIHNEAPIVYGLGNLIFESNAKEPNDWFIGYLAELTIKNHRVIFKAIPYSQTRESRGTRRMDTSEKNRFFDEMQEKNNRLQDAAFIANQWLEYCRKNKSLYLSGLFGYRKYLRIFRNIFLPIFHTKEEILRALLLVQCETHQEILNTLFRDLRDRK